MHLTQQYELYHILSSLHARMPGPYLYHLLVSLILWSVNNIHCLLRSNPIFCLVSLLLLMNLQNDFLFPLMILLVCKLILCLAFLIKFLHASALLYSSFLHLTYCLFSAPFLDWCEAMGKLWFNQAGLKLFFFLFYQEATPPEEKEVRGGSDK